MTDSRWAAREPCWDFKLHAGFQIVLKPDTQFIPRCGRMSPWAEQYQAGAAHDGKQILNGGAGGSTLWHEHYRCSPQQKSWSVSCVIVTDAGQKVRLKCKCYIQVTNRSSDTPRKRQDWCVPLSCDRQEIFFFGVTNNLCGILLFVFIALPVF